MDEDDENDFGEPTRNAYLKSELRNILAGLALATSNSNQSDEYVAGYSAALLAVAVTTGLEKRPKQRTVTVSTRR